MIIKFKLLACVLVLNCKQIQTVSDKLLNTLKGVIQFYELNIKHLNHRAFYLQTAVNKQKSVLTRKVITLILPEVEQQTTVKLYKYIYWTDTIFCNLLSLIFFITTYTLLYWFNLKTSYFQTVCNRDILSKAIII